MNDTIQVLIADDHEIVRQGLKTLISTCPDMKVVGEAANGIEAVNKARQLRPDVILLDMLMPQKNGLEALVEIKEDNPEARVLVLTSFAEDEQILSAIKSGALGYLLKDSSPQELIQAIQAVYRGESWLHPSVARRLVNEFSRPSSNQTPKNPLTEREVEVLKLVAEGLSNQEISELLHVSERTVGKHVGSILDKLQLPNRTQAALYALRQGLVQLEKR
jgi:NarL family two-component system response regulator LiaR